MISSYETHDKNAKMGVGMLGIDAKMERVTGTQRLCLRRKATGLWEPVLRCTRFRAADSLKRSIRSVLPSRDWNAGWFAGKLWPLSIS